MNIGCTCCKLVGSDIKGLDLQFERVEGEDWCHRQNLLCVAHVGAANCTLQVVETGVTGCQGTCGETRFGNSVKGCQSDAGKRSAMV